MTDKVVLNSMNSTEILDIANRLSQSPTRKHLGAMSSIVRDKNVLESLRGSNIIALLDCILQAPEPFIDAEGVRGDILWEMESVVTSTSVLRKRITSEILQLMKQLEKAETKTQLGGMLSIIQTFDWSSCTDEDEKRLYAILEEMRTTKKKYMLAEMFLVATDNFVTKNTTLEEQLELMAEMKNATTIMQANYMGHLATDERIYRTKPDGSRIISHELQLHLMHLFTSTKVDEKLETIARIINYVDYPNRTIEEYQKMVKMILKASTREELECLGKKLQHPNVWKNRTAEEARSKMD